MKKFYLVIFVLAACFILHSHHARADVYDTFVQAQCIKDLNMLKIDVFSGKTETGFEHFSKKQKKLWESHGIRNYLSMIGTIRLIEDDNTPSKDPRDDRMTAINPIQTSCILIKKNPDGKAIPRKYSVHIEPYFFNTNRNGECGGAQTFAVTIKQADQILIDNVPFWYRCRVNPWISDKGIEGRRDERINSIEFHPDDNRFTFSGYYLDTDDYICDGAKNTCDPNKHIYIDAFKVFDLDKDMPVTAEKLYVTDPLQARYE